MVQVGDLMKYASVLQRKYGLGDGCEADLHPSCFIPKARHTLPKTQTPDPDPREALQEIKYIRYIDYMSSTSTSAGSLHSLASRPPSRFNSRARLNHDDGAAAAHAHHAAAEDV